MLVHRLPHWPNIEPTGFMLMGDGTAIILRVYIPIRWNAKIFMDMVLIIMMSKCAGTVFRRQDLT